MFIGFRGPLPRCQESTSICPEIKAELGRIISDDFPDTSIHE